MSKSPAYQWYVGDFRSDENVMLMNYEQQGVYRFLLDHQWLHGSIPNNPSLLSGLLKIDEKYFSEHIWNAIAPCFVEIDYLNLRMERDRTAKAEFLARQSENGKRGGRPKQVQSDKPKTQTKPKQNPNKSGGLILANPNESSSTSTSSSISSITPYVPQGDWEEFLATYPKRKGTDGRTKGKEKFIALCKTGVAPKELIDAARRYARDPTTQVGTVFIKQIPTWLNQKCYLDAYSEPEKTKLPGRDWRTAGGPF
jgi:uncharacterized protein YdaU (DUF1376 family)